MHSSRVEEYSPEERRILRSLSTPGRIQDWLDGLAMNFELDGGTLRSPRRVIRDRTAFCFEGAIMAAAALEFHGERPLLLALYAAPFDVDHAMALFRRRGRWGSITKTNHAVLRYREPVYRDVRELVMSHFHEYFTNDGRKSLRAWAGPLDLAKLARKDWRTTEDDLWFIDEAFDRMKRVKILDRAGTSSLRRASPTEIAAGKITGEPIPKKYRR